MHQPFECPITKTVRVGGDGEFEWISVSSIRQAIALRGFTLEPLKKDGTPYHGCQGEAVATVDDVEIARAAVVECRPFNGAGFSKSGILCKAILASEVPPQRSLGVFLPNASIVQIKFFGVSAEVHRVRVDLDMASYVVVPEA